MRVEPNSHGSESRATPEPGRPRAVPSPARSLVAEIKVHFKRTGETPVPLGSVFLTGGTAVPPGGTAVPLRSKLPACWIFSTTS